MEDARLHGIPVAWDDFKKAEWRIHVAPEWKALREAIATAENETSRSALIAELTPAQICLRDAHILLCFDPPDCQEAILALEEGRALSLRAALDLDSINPAQIMGDQARSRAKNFIVARDEWRVAQQKKPLLTNDLNPAEAVFLQEQHMSNIRIAHEQFLAACQAIRQYDDKNFLAPTPTLEEIGQAITRADEGLVYLVGEEKAGFALVVTRRGQRPPKVHYISLPSFTFTVLARLLQTDAPRTWRNWYGDAMSKEIQSGGFRRAQIGKIFNYLYNWGESVNNVLSNLPGDSGFAIALQVLKRRWSPSNYFRDLLDHRFDQFTTLQTSQLKNAFVPILLNTELEWLLMELGDTGINTLAQWLYTEHIHRVTIIPCNLLGLFPLPAIYITLFEKQGRLGELFEVTIAPSARALATAKLQAKEAEQIPNGSREVLAAGNPETSFQAIEFLEGAEREVEYTRQIAEAAHIGPVRCFTGKDITRKTIIPGLEHAWLAHLAMHGEYAHYAPLQSKIILAEDDDINEEHGHAQVTENKHTITLAHWQTLLEPLHDCEAWDSQRCAQHTWCLEVYLRQYI